MLLQLDKSEKRGGCPCAAHDHRAGLIKPIERARGGKETPQCHPTQAEQKRPLGPDFRAGRWGIASP
jgi:hypothetical protein